MENVLIIFESDPMVAAPRRLGYTILIEGLSN